ncbi:ATP-binding cassette domain-containing protein, partial [Nocardia gipuzkoensis]
MTDAADATPGTATDPSTTATAAAPPMIAMRKVDKHFGALHVLQDINLEVPKGQVVIVLGPSGSGKSTLCRTINRLEPIDSGVIAVDGV